MSSGPAPNCKQELNICHFSTPMFKLLSQIPTMSSSHDISIKKYNVTNISLPHSLKKTSSFIFEAMKERPFKIARLRELNASEKSELLDVFEFFTGEEHRGILQKLSTDDIQEKTLA